MNNLAGIENYEDLCNAIVVQALKDLNAREKKLLKKKEEFPNPTEEQRKEIRSLEASVASLKNWFGSDIYYGYTELSPDVLFSAYKIAQGSKRKMRTKGRTTQTASFNALMTS